VLAVLAVALLVRATALWLSAGAEPILDEQLYSLRAHALLDGRGFLGSYQSWVLHPEGRFAELPQYPGAWQPPGQTALIAGVMAVSGRSELAVKGVQVVLSVLSVALVYALGCAWFDPRSAFAAGGLAALYPNLIAFSHYLWSETLFIFLLLLALWLLTRRRSPPRPAEALAGGAVLGLAALTRGTALYFPPLLALWMALAWRKEWGRALRAAACAAAAALLVVLPWSARNTLLHGGLVLIETNGPYNLWRGNGSDAFTRRGDPRVKHYAPPFEGLPIHPAGNRTPRRLVGETKRSLGREKPTDLEIVRYAQASAWAAIRADPGAFVARIPLRLVDMWNPTSFLIRHFRFGAYGALPPLLEATVSAAAIGAYLVVMGLAGVGCWRARARPEAWLVLLLALFLSAVSALSFGLTRFRLPLMPLFMVLAGPVLAGWRGGTQRVQR
jgi:4-amino-4-deoxy-L-arabinose transferase-like glycosyltransferase